jgi:GNAT superfamily N-acetyltransferase
MAVGIGVGGGVLADLLGRVAARSAEFDGDLSVVPQPSARDAAVLAFTGHSVVAADVDPAWVRSLVPAGDLSAPLNPPFLCALERRLGRRVNNIDVLAVATGAAEPPALDLVESVPGDHPRVRRALRYRDGVRVWTVEGGVLVLGRGLAGRWEVAVEVDPAHRGRGLGRALAAAARYLVPAGEPLWAQIAPGNAASVRAFLASGFRPVGAEALLVRH